MIADLKGLHHFLLRHLFYPLVLASLFGLALFAGRVWRSDSFAYRNLVWNLLLAWVPYLTSLLAASLHDLAPRRWWWLLPPGALWLLFFPNAPYILTDFLHLEDRPGVPLWFDITMLTTFAWTGLILGIASLRTMQILVQFRLGRPVSWVFAAGALGLGGLGIYLGRFSRFNSWDLLVQPLAVIRDIAIRLVTPLNNLRFFGFTLLFSLFLFLAYVTFVAAHQGTERE